MEPAFLSHPPESESAGVRQYTPAAPVRAPFSETASADPTFAQSAFMVASDAWAGRLSSTNTRR
ncbi:MAG: hypothetical protein JWO93_941 [Micrococcaceae bacterium]|jgi:hypothetical protein|nr:hypothetical protein [Micrococcaceae bacterium]